MGPGTEEVEVVVVIGGDVVGEVMGWDVVSDVVVVGAEEPDLGLYVMPLAGQLDLEPSGFVGTNVPVTTLPLMS